MTTTTKAARKGDEDVANIRRVKDAAKRFHAAMRAAKKANQRAATAQAEFTTIIDMTPEPKRAYLQSLVEEAKGEG